MRGEAADAPLSEAARVMAERKLRCLRVTDGDRRLPGIITEAHFVRLAARLLELLAARREPAGHGPR